MRVIILIIILIFVSTGCIIPGKTLKEDTLEVKTIIANVNVIPMDSDRVIYNTDVVLENGIISEIRKGIATNNSFKIIDGTDKFLIPGLSDMHVHINNKNELLLFLANGVTTVQNMWGYESGLLKLMGFPAQLRLRDQINLGKILGPEIITSGPILEGATKTQPFMKQIKTPEIGEKEVIEQFHSGYDFIKVYDFLDTETYNRIIETAASLNIPVKGHVPFDVGLEKVLQSGQTSIEHLTGYIDPDKAKIIIRENLLEEYAALTAEQGVWNTPTVVLWQKRGLSADEKKFWEKHEGNNYYSFMQKFMNNKSIVYMDKSIEYEGSYNAEMKKISFKIIKALSDAGAGLLIGTDSGNPYVFPGWSVHEELAYFVEAGLTPFQALQSATVNSALSLNRLDSHGTIETGKIANLILLNSNPLKDITNSKDIFSIVVNGICYDQSELFNMVR